jgi:hypothetical protein
MTISCLGLLTAPVKVGGVGCVIEKTFRPQGEIPERTGGFFSSHWPLKKESRALRERQTPENPVIGHCTPDGIMELALKNLEHLQRLAKTIAGNRGFVTVLSHDFFFSVNMLADGRWPAWASGGGCG